MLPLKVNVFHPYPCSKKGELSSSLIWPFLLSNSKPNSRWKNFQFHWFQLLINWMSLNIFDVLLVVTHWFDGGQLFILQQWDINHVYRLLPISKFMGGLKVTFSLLHVLLNNLGCYLNIARWSLKLQRFSNLQCICHWVMNSI